jgi:beta-lactamase superfamily II metal-dependent hydrolase
MTPIAPKPDELEISLFGPGIGECIVLHLGMGDWIVVDSCLDGPEGNSIAETYLKSIGVDLSSQLKLILATHWHDDHVRGLGSLLEKARSAVFAHPAVYELADIYDLVLNGARCRSASATNEFGRVLDVLAERKATGDRTFVPTLALANRCILRLGGAERICDAEVVSLSPSDAVFARAKLSIQEAIAAVQSNRRPPRPSANEMSVAAWIRVGQRCVILGADLENSKDENQGWHAIVNSAERPVGIANAFKVPHHGALSAHHPQSWKALLTENPLAALTAHTPSRLPSTEDVARITALTNAAYLTSTGKGGKVPSRDNAVDRTLREVGAIRRTLLGKVGHIRIRMPSNSPSIQPLVHLANGAQLLSGVPQ